MLYLKNLNLKIPAWKSSLPEPLLYGTTFLKYSFLSANIAETNIYR